MKIFNRKWVLVEDLKRYESRDDLLTKANKALAEDLKSTQDELDQHKNLVETLTNDKVKVIKSMNKQIDKLTKEIQELNKNHIEQIQEYQKQVVELNKIIEELKSDRYLVRKVPSGRKPKGQNMKVKLGSSTKPSVRNHIKNEVI